MVLSTPESSRLVHLCRFRVRCFVSIYFSWTSTHTTIVSFLQSVCAFVVIYGFPPSILPVGKNLRDRT